MEEKKINKKKQEIIEAQKEREKLKIRYDSSIIILEGQRNTVKELETQSNKCLEDFLKSDDIVKQKIDELSKLTKEIHEN